MRRRVFWTNRIWDLTAPSNSFRLGEFWVSLRISSGCFQWLSWAIRSPHVFPPWSFYVFLRFLRELGFRLDFPCVFCCVFLFPLPVVRLLCLGICYFCQSLALLKVFVCLNVFPLILTVQGSYRSVLKGTSVLLTCASSTG